MANHTLHLTGVLNGTVQMTNNGNVDVSQTDTITWVIDPTSGITGISSIVDNSLPTNVFSEGPGKMPGASTSWKGTISPTIPNDTDETYTINVSTASSPNPIPHDPQIRVNPSNSK